MISFSLLTIQESDGLTLPRPLYWTRASSSLLQLQRTTSCLRIGFLYRRTPLLCHAGVSARFIPCL